MATSTAPTPVANEPLPGAPRHRWARPDWIRLGASLASGVLLAMAFPPLDLGPLALVALVPLLWAWRDATARRAALYGFAFGVAFFGILLSWIWNFGAIAFVPLVLTVAAYPAGAGALVAVFARSRLRSPWLTAAIWLLLEQLRGRFPFGGLAWGEAGAALHDLPVARALAGWGGVALVTFLVVAVNGLVADALVSTRSRSWNNTACAAAGVAMVLALTAAGYAFRYEPEPVGDPLRIATIQGNDQNRDIESRDEYIRVVMNSHFRLADERLEGDYDLIVFPESSIRGDPVEDRALRGRVLDVGAEHDAVMLVNARVPAPDGRDYNTNFVFDPDGGLQGTYIKQHLVPFGEYVPFRDQLSFLSALEQAYNYAPGPGRRLFDVSGRRMATIICFESAFGPLVRDFVRDGAEFVVVSTNNRSFRRSANSAQHLALTQMRAAETGRPFIQAAISGISGIIEPDGDVHDTTDLFEHDVVTAEITPTTGETPYVRYGEWVTWGCGLMLIGLALFARLRRAPAVSTSASIGTASRPS